MEQWRLANIAGCSEETIRRIEKGRLKISSDLAETISRATGVSAQCLLRNDLAAPLLAVSGNPYNAFHFDAWQHVKSARLDGDLIDKTPDYLLSYYTRLRGVLASAGGKGEQQWLLAFAKLDKAVNALRAEFGTTAAYDDGQNGPRLATYELPLIEHDVRGAREHFEKQGIELDPTPTDETMRNYRNFRLAHELSTETPAKSRTSGSVRVAPAKKRPTSAPKPKKS